MLSMINDDVFKLDISMRDVLFVEVLQGLEQLLDDPLSLVFLKLPVRHCFKVCMQAFSLGVLHHKVDVPESVNGLDKLDDVTMVELRQDLNFPNGLLFPLVVE